MLKLEQNAKVGKATPTPTPERFFIQFQTLPPAIQGAPWQIIGVPDSGIPMRDYFAAKIIANLSGYDDEPGNFAALARDAYRLADAMMKAREPEQPAKPIGFPPVD